MSHLEKLQKFILAKIRADGFLTSSQTEIEQLGQSKDFSTSDGICVEVGIPMPRRISKYSAGAIFAEIEFEIRVKKLGSINASRGVLEICEFISRSINFWTPPVESGYGKIFLREESAWRIAKNDANSCELVISFRAQSLLQ